MPDIVHEPSGGVDLSPEPAPRFELGPGLERLRQEAHTFAARELRPRAASMEWATDPAQRVAWDLVEEASRRGWRTLGLPQEDGGGGATVLALCVLIEELAWGDMGFAVLLDQTLKVQRILARLAGGETRRRFLDRFLADPRCVLAICFTEPETGSDYMIPWPEFRFRTRAEPRPDGSWVLNGFKRFISNGADAGFYLVFACTDPSRPAAEGTSAFLLEPGLPGFEVVQVHEKISQRTINNAALRFENVVLEPWRMVGEPHRGFAGTREILKESAIEAGATTLGTARAAYEMAVEHARSRVQGGRPLIEHANVACRLAEMHAQLEAARSLIWRAAWAVEHDPAYDYRLGSAAKLVAADTAVHVCLSAMEIHGGLAIMSREAGVEKCLRDCLSFLHSDGAQDSHRLRIADLIRASG
ncbi:MAG TPA: acyl-CoA dehydrogenase family protein [Candidatus Dormibacteraeota bacterium]|nr:acyl-CoA dehydrogenase family protein [Candidatus Dormibacteraeota bacterium]